MNTFDMNEIEREIRARRERSVSTDWAGLVPDSVVFLSTLISKAVGDEKAALYPLLLSECSRANNDRAELVILRQQVVDLPQDPLSKASLGYALAKRGMPQEALEYARDAIKLGKAQDRQLKYSATNLIRVGLLLDDYGAVREGLELLIADAKNHRLEDYGPEFDFLHQLDGRRLPPNLVRSYEALQHRPS
jgi:tetratricopeptide (TPR) repeat protein